MALFFLSTVSRGLSPRGRGNLRTFGHVAVCIRSIPAWAGQPLTSACRARWQWVYPRVGGATGGIAVGSRDPMGLSPRGRGNPHPVYHPPASCGSIPAWAGQPLRRPLRSCQIAVYPRVGGATVSKSVFNPIGRGLSPRGRGNRNAVPCVASLRRSIPAWAGQPRARTRARGTPGVYPRVGGATAAPPTPFLAVMGLSPRGRGNL